MEIKLSRSNRVYRASISSQQPKLQWEGTFASPADALAAIARWKEQLRAV